MATTEQIQTAVNNGRLYVIKLLSEQLIKFKGGCGSIKDILPITRLIRGLQFQLNADVNDDTTSTLYTCLIRALGGFMGTYTLDPDVNIPGTTIITIPVIQGYNDDKLPFQTTDENPNFVLSNYPVLFAPLYGNNPDLALYLDVDTEYPGDVQTPPIIEYQDDDITKPILSITYSYPIATKGYLRIAGKVPAQGGIPSGGSGGSQELSFSEGDLIFENVTEQWYLPIVLPINKVPVFVVSNNVQIQYTYDRTTTPARLYGFANNNTQSIKVFVI